MSRRTRILLGVTLGLVAWFAVTVVWATRPLSDSVTIGKDGEGKVVVATVTCNTLFDDTAMDANEMPTIVTPEGITPEWALPRAPCTEVHDEARLLFGINVAVFVLGIAALGFVASRTRPTASPRLAVAAA